MVRVLVLLVYTKLLTVPGALAAQPHLVLPSKSIDSSRIAFKTPVVGEGLDLGSKTHKNQLPVSRPDLKMKLSSILSHRNTADPQVPYSLIAPKYPLRGV